MSNLNRTRSYWKIKVRGEYEPKFSKNSNARGVARGGDVEALIWLVHKVKSPGVKLQTLLFIETSSLTFSFIYHVLSVSYCPGTEFVLRYEEFPSWLELISATMLTTSQGKSDLIQKWQMTGNESISLIRPRPVCLPSASCNTFPFRLPMSVISEITWLAESHLRQSERRDLESPSL